MQFDPLQYGADNGVRACWLQRAAERGDPSATTRLARLFEAGGVGLPANPALAYRYYDAGAKLGDARSQAALARALRDEAIVPQNMRASAKWLALAQATRRSAGRICTSPAVASAYYRVLERDDAAGAAILSLGTGGGLQLEPGTYKIIETKSDSVSVLSRPFVCSTILLRANVRVSYSGSQLEYVTDDANGNPMYKDTRAEDALKNAAAGAMSTIMNLPVPIYSNFSVTPLGANRYRVFLLSESTVMRNEISEDVNIR